MAAFSYQYHPLLVDPALLPNTFKLSVFSDHAHANTVPSSQFYPASEPLLEPSINVTNHETSCVDQSSKIAISDNEPSFVTKNQSPETSMVVDKLETGEQVTQKVTPVQKRRRNRNRNRNGGSPQSSKNATEGRNKKQKRNNGGVEEGDKAKAEKKNQKKAAEEPPTGYIHVRARRGQATDSHSLAERVRREKISARMKMLQRLVPGCDKVTGKALMLDEIINYVQSLQNQVEFLSMKLASINPMFYDFSMDIDNLMVRPEKLNSLASAPPSMPQCSPNQVATFADTTTITTTTSFPAANDYLLDDSASILLQAQRSNVFTEDCGSQFWEVEEQRQKLLNSYGFSDNLCSLN
ncbi:hypothetical protein L6164_014910 [Bauhinia variegata]|uniref:Uncharacterized protein n=1 Tax=Bauhinia variegata TaxID=167791 RepID=A0ACB9NMJ3_BAUVA|nr:hypothetical protein L6164_014910 [Bauhinia variegata]